MHRERLLQAGFLQEVIKGWYIPSRPDETGGSAAWFASFWDFCAAYLTTRFGTEWSLAPEQSLLLHAGDRSVPRQLLARSPRARNKVTTFAHETSLFETRAALPAEGDVEELDGLRAFALPAALVAVAPGFFRQHATAARAILATLADASDVLALLLDGGRGTAAGRIAAGLRNIGRDDVADDIVNAMRSAGHDVRETDPFAEPTPFEIVSRERSPHVARMRLHWRSMRERVLELFPDAPGLPSNVDAYLQSVDAAYGDDAYHSLSIEGYRVNPALVARVREGAWRPDENPSDATQRDALAARGYHEAFQAVKETVADILAGKNPGTAVRDDHGGWYRALFSPSVRVGILSPVDLAGYRNDRVFIRNARHVPPRCDAVRDLMPAFFDLLAAENEPAVRIVLGHFLFVFIHPYMDGNGRVGRFLMNAMLAAGGYPWRVVPVSRRNEYMAALEAASTASDIAPFAGFLASLLQPATGAATSASGP